MTDVLINGSDSTTVQLFHLDLPREAVERFTTMAGTGEWPLKYALGAETLRPGFVETLRIEDLGGMSLSRYLAEAHDLPPAALGADRDAIDALRGHVVVLPPQAFANTSQRLTPAAPLRHIGSYTARGAAPRGPALRSSGAEGGLGGGAAARPGTGGRTLTLVLAGLAALLLLGALFVFG
jgi:hypothetical protein